MNPDRANIKALNFGVFSTCVHSPWDCVFSAHTLHHYKSDPESCLGDPSFTIVAHAAPDRKVDLARKLGCQ
jgi:hypothetical protein